LGNLESINYSNLAVIMALWLLHPKIWKGRKSHCGEQNAAAIEKKPKA